jgi:hypothetical protein
MSIYVQHGWGKSDKIIRGISDNSVSGVIWSPRDEDPGSLPSTISQHKAVNPSVVMLIDPQFYVTTIPNPRAGKLPDYPYYPDSLLTRADFNNPQNIQDYARNTIDYQLKLNLDRLVSPTICFEDFQDQWSQIALMMANATINYHTSIPDIPPLLLSFVFSETALSSQISMEDFLDAVSMLNASGIYLIVRRGNQPYPTSLEPNRLENLLYLVYTLSDVNQFEVVCGYSDFESILLHAVGVNATGCGWYSNLRQFSFDRFQPALGGQPARPRYSSLQLLNSILVEELDSIYYGGQLQSVLSGGTYDGAFSNQQTPSNVSWPLDISTLHHWSVLQRATDRVRSGTSVGQRLDFSNNMIGQAAAMYQQLIQSGVTFETPSGNRNLLIWRTALANFRTRVGI